MSRWLQGLQDARLDCLLEPFLELLQRIFRQVAPAQSAQPTTRPAEPAPLPRLLLQNFAIAGGTFTFTDQTVQPTATASVDPVNFEMHDVSTLPNRQGEHVLNARLPGGGGYTIQGLFNVRPERFGQKLL